MKRYQVILLSFALGIFATTYFGVYFFSKMRSIVSISQEAQTPAEYETIKVFFLNSIKDPGVLYCDRIYPVNRTISRLSDNPEGSLGEYIYLALLELLKGPTENDKIEGYFSSINEGVGIRKIIVEDGIARVDFTSRFTEGVAGSCRVQAVRSQIENTLKQFSEIKNVVILVDGNSEEILQP